MTFFFSPFALQTPLWHETHQPLLDNDAVGAVKHSLGSPTATLDNLTGPLVEGEVTDQTANLIRLLIKSSIAPLDGNM